MVGEEALDGFLGEGHSAADVLVEGGGELLVGLFEKGLFGGMFDVVDCHIELQIFEVGVGADVGKCFCKVFWGSI